MAKKKDLPIPNWSLVSPTICIIDLFKHVNEGDTWYNVVVTHILGNDSSNTPNQAISFITAINGDDIQDALEQALEALSMMFETISATTIIYDGETGDEIETINLNDTKYLDNEGLVDETPSTIVNPKHTIH